MQRGLNGEALSHVPYEKSVNDFFAEFDSHCFIVTNLDEALNLLRSINEHQ